MNRFLSLVSLALVGTILLTVSCKKDDKSSGGGGTPTPTGPLSLMTATIDGTPWTSDTSMQSYFLVNNGCGEALGGVIGGDYQVTISIESSIAVGNSFVLGALSPTVKAVVEVSDGNGNIFTTNHPNGNGQLIVSSFNAGTRSVSLSFSCTLVEMSSGAFLSMTNGTFTYRPYFGPFPTNSLTANLNGQPFQRCAAFALNDLVEDQMVIVGQGPDNQYVEMYFPNFVTNGTTLPMAGLTELYVTGDTINMDNASLTSGVINITTYNPSTKRIAGTFSAQGTNNDTGNPVTISQGSFDMTYQDFLLGKRQDGSAERQSMRFLSLRRLNQQK